MLYPGSPNRQGCPTRVITGQHSFESCGYVVVYVWGSQSNVSANDNLWAPVVWHVWFSCCFSLTDSCCIQGIGQPGCQTQPCLGRVSSGLSPALPTLMVAFEAKSRLTLKIIQQHVVHSVLCNHQLCQVAEYFQQPS
ncbi:hypothetical protein mRhiFer1_009546 [Rhinolophus ferrumequinum]|uniref:Uncharacterized protein n=1 Tax=Rhinolophus ferrumequinum TaxID=59479 RepID=A0A7J7R8V0_RHIFE|nr:hypothetical protein mRhiFer1_009546 [Rhinolophus ferrumequinum]